MEIAKGINIPVISDNVLSPEIYYGDELTGIYFPTEDEQFGRITFENLDAIKICRGENLPYDYNWASEQERPWVYRIENSKWLKERFEYENANYGSSYEFGGNVNEMLTDFSHYVFKFHDEFAEVISRGFWFEKDITSLFKKDLQIGHPFLPLPEKKMQVFEVFGIKYKVILNPEQTENIIENTKYCRQKLVEFAIELDGSFSVSLALILMQRQSRLISVLAHSFGQNEFVKEGVAEFEDVKEQVENFIKEISERRKQMRK